MAGGAAVWWHPAFFSAMRALWDPRKLATLDPGRLGGVSPPVKEGKVDNVAAVIVYGARPRDLDTVLSDGRVH